MYSRILVPLDGSRLAESVLPVVERLASPSQECEAGATVLLLHIVERGAPSAVHGERHLTRVEDATPYLDELGAGMRVRGIAVETHAHPAPEGNVAGSIVDHGAELGADLIVLCTHGRGSMRDLLFGRIAQQVLRRGTIPVLLVRPRDEGRVDSPFTPRIVLVPLDGASPAEAALEPALEIAEHCGAGLRLISVVPTQETLRGDRQAVGTLLPAATRAALDLEEGDAHTYLARLAADLSTRAVPGLAISVEVHRGDVADALAEQAAAPDVGLVVMATHARAGLQAMWGGSVAAHLLARIHVPILLIRSPH